MIPKNFTLKTSSGSEIPVYSESFTGPFDLLATQDARKPRTRLDSVAHLHGASPSDPHWYGFSNSADLRDKLIKGVRDDKLTWTVKKFADAAKVQDKEKLRDMRLNVCGGAVCIPAYLSDSPKNMWMMHRKRVPSRILHLGIDASMCAWNSADTYRKVGSAMVKTIARLEKAGYRVRVTGVISVYDDVGRSICMMTLPMKMEHEVMNFRKILYPLTDVSFFRGIGFDWLACYPKFSGNNTHLGQETQSAFRSSDEDRLLQEMYEKVLGNNVEFIAMRDMASMIRSGKTEDQVQAFIESRILNTDA